MASGGYSPHLQRPMTSPIKGRVVVYSIVGCPHCLQAKSLLTSQGIPFQDVSLNSFPQVRDWLRAKTGRSSVPQIFFNNVHIGGNRELQQLALNQDEWRKMVDWLRATPPPQPNDGPMVPNPAQAVARPQATAPIGVTCETDQDVELIHRLRKTDYVRDRVQPNFLKRCLQGNHKDTITGSDFVKYIQETKRVDRTTALELGAALMSRKLIKDVTENQGRFQDSPEAVYALVENELKSKSLNADVQVKCAPKSVLELGEQLRKLILDIHAKFLSSDGRSVDYRGIRGSQDFVNYKARGGE